MRPFLHKLETWNPTINYNLTKVQTFILIPPWRMLWWILTPGIHTWSWSAWPGPPLTLWETPSSPRWGRLPGWRCRSWSWSGWRTTRARQSCEWRMLWKHMWTRSSWYMLIYFGRISTPWPSSAAKMNQNEFIAVKVWPSCSSLSTTACNK